MGSIRRAVMVVRLLAYYCAWLVRLLTSVTELNLSTSSLHPSGTMVNDDQFHPGVEENSGFFAHDWCPKWLFTLFLFAHRHNV